MENKMINFTEVDFTILATLSNLKRFDPLAIEDYSLFKTTIANKQKQSKNAYIDFTRWILRKVAKISTNVGLIGSSTNLLSLYAVQLDNPSINTISYDVWIKTVAPDNKVPFMSILEQLHLICPDNLYISWVLDKLNYQESITRLHNKKD